MRALFASLSCSLAVLACGGPAARPVAPPAEARAPAADRTRAWFVEEASDTARGPMLYLDVSAEPTLLLTPNATHQTLRRAAKGWEAKRTSIWGTGSGVYVESPKGERWIVDVRGPDSLIEFYLTVFHGKDASIVEEPIGKTNALSPSIVVDDEERPHLCYTIASEEKPAGDLFYATRAPGGGAWKTERIADATPATRCTITTGPAGLLHVVHGDDGKTVRVTTRTPAGALRVATLGEGTFTVGRPKRGVTTVALAEGRNVRLFRRDDAAVRETWNPSPVVLEAPSAIAAVAIAFDARGKARVAAATSGAGAILGVASEGDGLDRFREVIKLPSQTVDTVAIAVDAHDAEHVAFFAQIDPQTMPQPYYARPWRDTDSPDDRGRIAIDREGMTEGCGRALDVAFGAAPTANEAQRSIDQSACWLVASGKGPSLAWLGARCDKGDASACFVAGMVAAPRAGIGRYRAALRWLPSCPPEQPRCARIWEGSDKLTFPAWPTPDLAEATKRFGRACELGRAAACVPRSQIAFGAKDPLENELVERACAGGIESACLMVFMHVHVRKISTSSSDLAKRETLMKRIEDVCARTKDADACNIAAFLDESQSKTNPPDRFAEDKHVVACEGGSMSSCARLVLMKGKRPRPSSNFVDFVYERVEEAWAAECREGAEDACLALVNAYETGWAVKADPAKAKVLLGQICDAGKSPKACARLGKAPKK